MGHWKNYDELEENLSLEELMATLEAVRDRDYKDKKFMAALQGIDLDKETKKSEETITDISPIEAQKMDLGIGKGLQYKVEMG